MEQVFFNPLQHFAAGRQMGEQQVGQNLLRQYGAAAMQGDQNALNALAANPYTMDVAMGHMDRQQRQANADRSFGMEQQRLAISQEQLAMTRERARMETEQLAAAGRLAEAEREAEQVKTFFGNLGAAKAAGNQQAYQAIAANGPEEFRGIGWDDYEGAATIAGAAMDGFFEATNKQPDYKYDNGQYWDANNPQAGAQPVPGYVEKGGQSFSVSLADGTEVSFGSGGQQPQRIMPTDPGKLGFEVSKNDAAMLKDAQEQAGAADSLAINTDEAERILMSGMPTGMEARGRAFFSGIGASTGLSSGQYREDYQELDRVSKAVGIDTLRAMGGNDTERELLTAIQTTVSPGKEEGANKRTLAAQRAAVDTITEKPGLMEAWIRDYGSLANTDADGNNWSSYWRQYQIGKFRERRTAYLSYYGIEERRQEQAPAQQTATAGSRGRNTKNSKPAQDGAPDFIGMSEEELTDWLRNNGGY